MTFALTILEPVDVPEELDPVERATWARQRWELDARIATRHSRDGSVRETIAVPCAPIASWLVENWWSVLYEASPVDEELVGREHAGVDTGTSLWRHRHSLGTADSSLRLPDLRFFSAGRALAWTLHPDVDKPPLRYIEAGSGLIGRDAFVAEAGKFISWTLSRLSRDDNSAAAWLRDRWTAIRGAMAASDVHEFCRAGGRLGLDPHDTSDWPEGIVAFFESQPTGALDRAFAADFLSSGSDVRDLPALAKALQGLADAERLEGHDVPKSLRDGFEGTDDTPAWKRGYARAERLRRDAGLHDQLRKVDQPALLQRGADVVLTSKTVKLPGPISAVAGWNQGRVLVVERHRSRQRDASARFAIARGLYLALWCAEDGARLAVDAHTDDQQAARAFAAELLAPRNATLREVETRARSMPFDDALIEVAAKLAVDPVVVGHQVENARAGR